MSIINWLEYEKQNHVISWVLLHAIAEQKDEIFNDSFDSSKLDVSMTINGVDVDVIETLTSLQSQLVRIESAGVELGKKIMFGELQDFLTERGHEGY